MRVTVRTSLAIPTYPALRCHYCRSQTLFDLLIYFVSRRTLKLSHFRVRFQWEFQYVLNRSAFAAFLLVYFLHISVHTSFDGYLVDTTKVP